MGISTYVMSRVPTLFWSAPGCGKSAVIADFARSSGGEFHVLYPARVDPMTLAGLPHIETDGVVRMAPWAWVPRLNRAAEEGRLSVLFVDEVNGGDAQQLAAVQSLVAERRIADIQLHKDVCILAAANPVAVSTGGIELPPPIMNRFAHVRWFEEGPHAPAPAFPFVLSKKEWISWMRERGGGHGLVAMAIEALGLPAAETPEGEKPFASPRSWYMVGEIFGYLAPSDPAAEGLALGAVGPVGAKAVLWLRDLDLPTAEQLLAGAEIPAAPDKAAACVEVIRAYVSRHGRGGVKIPQLIRAIGRMAEKHPGLGMVLASRVGKVILDSGHQPDKTEAAILTRLLGVE